MTQFAPDREFMDQPFCSCCGARIQLRIPQGDHLQRRVCPACGVVHYENPRIVVGCIPEWGDQILLCVRAIEPRRGSWTFPAGFMENGETLQQGAARECREEALAEVEIGSLLAVVNIPEAHQVHMFFRARLTSSVFGAGPESLDARLVDVARIPWDELAFPSTRFALQRFVEDLGSPDPRPHITTLSRRLPG